MKRTSIKASKKTLRAILVVGMTTIVAPLLCLGQNVFVQMEGILGEATEASHRGWIDAHGFSDGITPQAAPAGTMAIARSRTSPGGAGFDSLKIMKTIDKASVALRRKAAEGGVIKNVTIDITREEDGKIFLQITLENVTVAEIFSTVDPSAHGPLETVSLKFRRIKYVYTEYDSSGRPKGNVEFRWDTTTNTIY